MATRGILSVLGSGSVPGGESGRKDRRVHYCIADALRSEHRVSGGAHPVSGAWCRGYADEDGFEGAPEASRKGGLVDGAAKE